MRTILLSFFLMLVSPMSIADLTVYWATDDLSSVQVQQSAEQLTQALEQKMGVDVEMNIVSTEEANRAFVANTADIIVTCNEVSSLHGAPMGSVSNQSFSESNCHGGSLKNHWQLSVDQGVQRQKSAEYWVYFMRSSERFSQARALRDAVSGLSRHQKAQDMAKLSL